MTDLTYRRFSTRFRAMKRAGFNGSQELEIAARRLRNALWAVTHNPGKDVSVFRRELARALPEFETVWARLSVVNAG